MIEWIEDFWKIAFENKSQQNILTENKKKNEVKNLTKICSYNTCANVSCDIKQQKKKRNFNRNQLTRKREKLPKF